MSLPRAAPRVVAAVSADMQPRLRAILPGCELRFIQTGSELVRALDEARCEMLIVQVHFDEWTAVAALRCVLAREATFPVVCVRDVPFAKPGYAALDALRMALGGIVVRDFIDLVEHGDDAPGNERVRATLLRLLPDESRAAALGGA
jgi:hypothetical protein